jgi:catabolite regulation protein CreA
MNQSIRLLDTVALLKAMPGKNLRIGQVGAVVEILGDDNFEIEFTDKQGRTIALLPLKRTDLLVLQYEMEAK